MSIKLDIKLISIDETGLNLHCNTNFGYKYKGFPAYKHVSGKGKNLSVIMVIDQEKIIGSMIFDGSVKSEDFCYFISNIITKLKNEGLSINYYISHFENANSAQKILFLT